jgi:molybdenum cofactor synthesis domain-containing protein
MRRVITAGIIAIGDEILRGDTRDTNSGFLCRELYARGVEVRRCVVLPDELEQLVPALRSFTAEFDWVVACGGIGPTPDDLTRQAAAEALGAQLVLDEQASAEYARRRGAPLNEGQLEMCRLPEGAELVWSKFASPPAFFLRNLLVLPGVPQILKSSWSAVADRFAGAERFCRIFRTGTGESRWAHVMLRFIEQYPQLKFGSYPKMDREWWVEVRIEGPDMETVEAAATALEDEIEQIGASPV